MIDYNIVLSLLTALLSAWAAYKSHISATTSKVTQIAVNGHFATTPPQ
jgi:hypothetical protein